MTRQTISSAPYKYAINTMNTFELRTLIQEAWEETQFTEQESDQNVESPEAGQVASFFSGRNWKGVSFDELLAFPGDATACLRHMSAETFQQFVASFMLIALDHYENSERQGTQAWAIATSAVYNLAPPPFGRFKNERLSFFTIKQKRAVIEFLRYIACCHSEDYPMDEPNHALFYWSKEAKDSMQVAYEKHMAVEMENAWWKGQESLVSDSDEQLAVVGPRADATQDELRQLGQRLRLWQQTNSFVKHICGLDRLLEGKDPRTPPIYLSVPYIGSLSECYESVALVFVEKGTDHAVACDSLAKAVDELRSRLASFCDPDQYGFMQR